MNITTDRLEGLAAAAAALAGELSLDAVLETIVAAAARVTGARYAALGVIGDDQTISSFITHGASPEVIAGIGHYPRGKGLLGLLIRDPQLIRLDDIAEHPASYGFPPNHPPMQHFLGAPVRSGATVYGNIYLTEKDGGFTGQDEQLLMVLAAQAGAAIENALLSDRLQSMAVQDERDRISRELHDGVIQSLFSIGMGLEGARALLANDPVRADQRISGAVDGIDEAIRELRNYIFRLRPHQAGMMGLRRGLQELAREYEVNALVRPQLEVPSNLDARVPEGLTPDVLQVVREALSNAAKHAGASNLRIRCVLQEGALVLEVHDDGVGFSAQLSHVGRGTDNMRERATAIGGSLEIDSEPGAGTCVRLRVPIEESAP